MGRRIGGPPWRRHGGRGRRTGATGEVRHGSRRRIAAWRAGGALQPRVNAGCGRRLARGRSRATQPVEPPRSTRGRRRSSAMASYTAQRARRREGPPPDRRPPVRPRQRLGRGAAPCRRRERLPRAPRLGRVRRVAPRPHRRRERRARRPAMRSSSATSGGSTGRAIIACHFRAAEWRHKEIELAAHELLQVPRREVRLGRPGATRSRYPTRPVVPRARRRPSPGPRTRGWS